MIDNIIEIIKIVYEPSDSVLETAFQWTLKTFVFFGFLRWFYLTCKEIISGKGEPLPWWMWLH